MFFNLSVSYADSSLYQREPCTVDCLHLINESLAIHSAYNTDLQLNKHTKESRSWRGVEVILYTQILKYSTIFKDKT